MVVLWTIQEELKEFHAHIPDLFALGPSLTMKVIQITNAGPAAFMFLPETKNAYNLHKTCSSSVLSDLIVVRLVDSKIETAIGIEIMLL